MVTPVKGGPLSPKFRAFAAGWLAAGQQRDPNFRPTPSQWEDIRIKYNQWREEGDR